MEGRPAAPDAADAARVVRDRARRSWPRWSHRSRCSGRASGSSAAREGARHPGHGDGGRTVAGQDVGDAEGELRRRGVAADVTQLDLEDIKIPARRGRRDDHVSLTGVEGHPHRAGGASEGRLEEEARAPGGRDRHRRRIDEHRAETGLPGQGERQHRQAALVGEFDGHNDRQLPGGQPRCCAPRGRSRPAAR